MRIQALISLLSDRHIHSGESLAQQLGVSRTAVWKQVRKAQDEGYVIETISGSAPLEYLRRRIRELSKDEQ